MPMAFAAPFGAVAAAQPGASPPPTTERLYPEPLFVKNTFLNMPEPRPWSLDGCQERQAISCPTSSLDLRAEASPGCALDGLHEALVEVASSRRQISHWSNSVQPADIAQEEPPRSPSPRPLEQQPPLPADIAPPPLEDRESIVAGTADLQPTYDGYSCATFVQCPFDVVEGSASVHSYLGPHGVAVPVLLLHEVLSAPLHAQLPPPTAYITPGDEIPPTALYITQDQAQHQGGQLPSIGSMGHHAGECRPCAFTAKGCATGRDCRFCHLCDVGEHKRQKKEKYATRRMAVKMKNVLTGATRDWMGRAKSL